MNTNEEPIEEDYYLKYPPLKEETNEVPKEETNIDFLTRRVINHLGDYTIKGVLIRQDVNDLVVEARLSQKELQSLRDQLAAKEKELSVNNNWYQRYKEAQKLNYDQGKEIQQLKEQLQAKEKEIENLKSNNYR